MHTTRKFLIATHGKLAGGVKSSLDIITDYAKERGYNW